MRSPKARETICALLAIVTLAGCGGQSPADKEHDRLMKERAAIKAADRAASQMERCLYTPPGQDGC